MTKKFNGHCETIPVKKGDMVTIPKGAIFFTTAPEKLREAKKSYKVKVFSTDNGCDAYKNYHGENVPARNPRIDWVGAGGYWCWIELNDLNLPE